MTQSTNTLVTAADYADSLIVARRVKTTLCTLLFFLLGAELTLFFLFRYLHSLGPVLAVEPPTQTAAVWYRMLFEYLIGLLDYAGLILPLLLFVLVLVILQVQLVARLVGTGRVTSGLVWAILLVLLLFPWQAVLNNPGLRSDPVASAIGLKVPGVVYTWAEVSHPTLGARFAEFNAPADPANPAAVDRVATALHWLRYAVFPLLAMVVVGVIHTKTERGLRQSFGTDVVVLPPETTLDTTGGVVTGVDPVV